MDDKEKRRTGPGVSDPQGPAGVGSIVPAPPPSSSDVGPSLVSPESTREERTISDGASGLRKLISERCGSPPGPTTSPGSKVGGGPSPGPSPQASTSSGAAERDAVFKRPGPLSSKKKKEVRPAEAMDLTSEDDSSDDVSGSGGELTPFSDMSSDTNRALGATKKRGRGRPATTGEWVGVESVRHELALLRREHERVVAERDVLARESGVDFGRTAGGIPSAYDMMEGLTNEPVGSLLDIVTEEMEAVERVAERSGSLKGTFKGTLRAASRRAVAAARVLFSRANERAREGGSAFDLERARCELQAAKGLLEESKEKVRRLEGEVEVLRAKETLWDSKARGAPPPPRRPSHSAVAESVPMEVEDSPLSGRAVPPEERASASIVGDLATDPDPSPDLVEKIVDRVLARLSPRGEVPDQPPAPSRLPPGVGWEKWSKVAGRRAPKEKKAKALEKESPPPPAPASGGGKGKKRKRKKGPKQRGTGEKPSDKAPPQKKKAKAPVGVVREPRSGAVLLTADPAKGATLTGALNAMKPTAMEFLRGKGAKLSVKRAQAGGILIQLAGGEGHRLADGLAAIMREAASEVPGVGVRRPLKRAELRLQGLDDSVTREEVVGAVAGLTGCRTEDVTVGEIRFLPYRLGSVWLRCPVAVSNKLLEEGRLRVGWAEATVKPLPARRMRCYRCLEVGHGKAGCKGPDRSGRCYRCGDCSHRSQQCSAGVPKCPLCADFGIPAGHSLGAAACVTNERAALRRKLAGEKKAAKEKARDKGGARSCGADATPAVPGGRSKGGPRRAQLPETPAPAGPAGGERGTRPVVDEGSLSRAPEKGSTDGGGDRPAKSSLKRTASDRSPSIQRGTTAKRDGGEEKEESPPPPPPIMKKRRDRRGRFKTH